MSKKKLDRNLVTQQFVFYDYETLDAAALGELLVILSPAGSGLGSYSGQLTNFFDMYRLARLDAITVETQMELNAATSYQGWFLAYLPAGSAAPSNLLSIETQHASKLASGNVANSANRAVLHLTRRDMPPLAEAGGPGPGWLATASDGPTSTWGDIYIVNTSPAGSGAPAISTKVTLTMSFYELIDPTLISARIEARKDRTGRPKKYLRGPPKCKDDDEDLSMSRLKAQLKALSSK